MPLTTERVRDIVHHYLYKWIAPNPKRSIAVIDMTGEKSKVVAKMPPSNHGANVLVFVVPEEDVERNPDGSLPFGRTSVDVTPHPISRPVSRGREPDMLDAPAQELPRP